MITVRFSISAECEVEGDGSIIPDERMLAENIESVLMDWLDIDATVTVEDLEIT